MIIEEKSKSKIVEFYELDEGQLFYYLQEECYCIKTDEDNRAVTLENGLLLHVSDYDNCLIVEGKIVIG